MVTEEMMQALADAGQLQEREQQRYEAEVESWWNSLSEEDRERAFYAVVSRIVKGDIVDRGSYRYVLYQVFGFDAHMYMRGMDCGYMTLHNSIVDHKGEDI
jgi:hypothetical protein